MERALFLIALSALAFAAPAQRPSETPFLLKLNKTNHESAVLAEKFTRYEVFELPANADYPGEESCVVVLQFGEEAPIMLELIRSHVLLTTEAVVATALGDSTVRISQPRTYRGRRTDVAPVRCALTLEASFCCGYLDDADGAWCWEPLHPLEPGASPNLVVRYRAADVRPDARLRCLLDATPELPALPESLPGAEEITCFQVRIAEAADYSMWQQYGDAAALTRHLASVLNLAQMNYDYTFDLDLELKIAGLWFSSCPSCDPWTSVPDPDSLVYGFAGWAETAAPFNQLTFDVGQLWTDRDLAGGYVGWAFVGGACYNGIKYHWIKNYSTSLHQLRALVAHELGHNLGATHDANAGAIMSPNPLASATWSAASQTAVNTYLAAKPADCFARCYQPCAASTVWSQTLGGATTDIFYSVALDNDGQWTAAGTHHSVAGIVPGWHGAHDAWITRFAGNGEVLWQRAYGGADNDLARNVIAAADGGVIFVGSSYSSDGDLTVNHGQADGWVVRLDPDGTLLWQIALGGAGDETLRGVAELPNGDLIIVGSSSSSDGAFSSNNGQDDGWVVRLDASGNVLWQQLLGGPDVDILVAVDQTADGALLLAGNRNAQAWAVKMAFDGTIEWQYTYGGSSTEITRTGIATADGGYILAAMSVSQDGDVSGNHGYSDAWIVRLGPDGQLLWQRSLGGPQNDQPWGLAEGPDGAVYVAGSSRDAGGDVGANYGQSDAWIVKLRVSGTLLWEKNMGTPGNDVAYGLAIAPNGALIVAGSIDTLGPDVPVHHGGIDGWLARLAPSQPVTIDFSVTRPCAGQSNGSIAVEATGGSTYTYLWSNGATTPTLNNLPGGGTYTVTVTANTGCSAAATQSIAAAASLQSSVLVVQNSCGGQANGAASAGVAGGTPPYTYVWNNGQTTPVATGFAPGLCQVTVTDANGCTTSNFNSMGSWPIPAVAITATMPACPGVTDGSLTASASGAGSPFYFVWSNGQEGPTVVGLPAGTYTVTVTSAQWCSATATAIVPLASPPVVAVNAFPACTGAANGLAMATATGTMPLTYAWSSGQTTSFAADLPAGHYVLTVTDANGCTNTALAAIVDTLPYTVAPVLDGPPAVCIGSAATFTLSPVAAATQFYWTAPSGALIDGQAGPVTLGWGGQSATVTFGAASGPVCVVAGNGCQETAPRCRIVAIAQPDTTWLPFQTLCAGDSFAVCGQAYAQPGTYVGHCPSATGCDSVVVFTLEYFGSGPLLLAENPVTIAAPAAGTQMLQLQTTITNLDTLPVVVAWESLVLDLTPGCIPQFLDAINLHPPSYTAGIFELGGAESAPLGVFLWDSDTSVCCGVVYMRCHTTCAPTDTVSAVFIVGCPMNSAAWTPASARPRVTPNPGPGQFRLVGGEAAAWPDVVTIYALDGRQLMRQAISPWATAFSLQAFPPGTYLAVFGDGAGRPRWAEELVVINR